MKAVPISMMMKLLMMMKIINSATTMNKTILTICAIAAATLLAGCQKEINTEPIQEETFHSVIFTAEKIIDTKTAIASEENGTVSYKWNDDDWERMYITESYISGEQTVTNAGTVTGMTLSNGGKSATFNVTFPGSAPETGVSYDAVYGGHFSNSHNPLIPSEQSPLADTFDPAADVLVSDGFTKTTVGENPVYKFTMKRKVSVNKMTLKGLVPGETISSVTFESDKYHSAYYTVSSDSYDNEERSLTFSFSGNNTVSDEGEFPVYFTTAPVTDATFTVSVVTNQHRYIKQSTKKISFAVGQVRRFGVDLTGCESTGRVFNLVTDVNDLLIGADVVIAANGSKNIAMSTTQNSNNRGETEATKSADGSTITATELVQVFKLVAGATSGTYAFSFDNNGTTNYLYAASSSSNWLRSQEEKDANASWTIDISNNEATVTAQGEFTRNILRYNSGDKLFSCYSSGQQTVYLYQASALSSPGMSWSSSTATATLTGSGILFEALTLNPGNASPISYDSSVPEVASNTANGTVNIVGEGTTIISAIFDGNANYAPQTVSYTLTVTDERETVATPTFNPGDGVVTAGTTVTITTTTSGATIYYTTDGTTPTSSANEYTSPIAITETTTINAIAVKENFKDSEVATATYVIPGDETTYTKVTSAPSDWSGTYILVYEESSTSGRVCKAGEDVASNYETATISSGVITTNSLSAYEVEIATYSTGYSIKALGGTNANKYLQGKGSGTNGTDFQSSPSKETTLEMSSNNSVVTITNNTYVFAYNSAANNLRWRFFKAETVGGSGYHKPALYKKISSGAPTVEEPTFSPEAGSYTSAQTITLSCGTSGASIFYTTDGSTPDGSKTEYTTPFTISETTTVKAVAIKDGISSEIVTANYTISNGPMTIADVINTSLNTAVYTQGIVAQVNLKGFIITDGSDNILVYQNATPSVVVGQAVTIRGIRGAYNNVSQINGGDELIITPGDTGQEVTRTNLTTITSSNATGYSTNQYVSLSGQLTSSNNYYNVSIIGSSTKGSLYQINPNSSFTGGTLTSLLNKKVTVTGYITGSSTSYLYIAVVDIQEDESNEKWNLVSSLAGITEGKYAIAAYYQSKYYAVPNSTISGQTFTCIETSYSESDGLTLPDGGGEFTFTAVDGKNNAFYIFNTTLNMYLVATGSKKFGYVDSSNSNYGYWTFSTVSSGGFSGTFSVKHSNTTHYMRAYNNSVRCYDGASNSGIYLFISN